MPKQKEIFSRATPDERSLKEENEMGRGFEIMRRGV
jgi:hypothetical protein